MQSNDGPRTPIPGASQGISWGEGNDVRQAIRCWMILLAGIAMAAPLAALNTEWRLARSRHFEVYAQAGDQRALAILAWFEQLRAFFELEGGQTGDRSSAAPPVRVVVFASEQEYAPYRLRSTADAYYVGGSSQDYIVIGSDHPAGFSLASHEYAHLALRASGLDPPPWLAEGMAEFFATLRITAHGAELGGALPGRIQTLGTRAWMPIAELLAVSKQAQIEENRRAADLFYSESWALTEMLMLSPKYAPRFRRILASPVLDAAEVTRDLRKWIAQAQLPVIRLSEVETPAVPLEVSSVAPLKLRILLAQVLLAAGEYDRAHAQFMSIRQDAPDSAEIASALGVIALHEGDTEGARREWKRAIELGIADPELCYRYAILADQAGLPPADIRPALERAVALQPDFDDAHYQLALLEKNARHYEAALDEFHAIRHVPESRAYAYWLALADAFNELGRRDEAQSAARQASEHATTAAQRARAAQQIRMAQTDLGVQFSRDASGELQLVTTRVPHQQTDWNPFVEPGDDMRRIQGTLREIHCGATTTIRVEQAGKLLTLSIPDLKHVQMRHAPADFVCGPQAATPVTIDYAQSPRGSSSDGVVRGMQF